MGTLSGWKAGVFVDHKEAKRAVTQRAGYDPDNLAQYGDPEDGWRMTGGHATFKSFGRRIWNAYRRGYWLKEIPLTEKGPKRGQWGLTPAGLETARSYAGFQSVGNTTAQFLDQRLKETGGLGGRFWGMLRAAVATKFPISNKAGLLDDHIQTCMMRLIHRDSLRERVLSGQNITDTHIATYVVRSAINDCRDAATEPLTRELYGARTVKERVEGVEPLCSPNPSKITWNMDEGCWEDVVDFSSPTDQFESQSNFREVWKEIKSAVIHQYPDSWEQLLWFTQLRSEGYTIQETADKMNVTITTAHSYMHNMKRCREVVWESGVLDGILERTVKKPARTPKTIEAIGEICLSGFHITP